MQRKGFNYWFGVGFAIVMLALFVSLAIGKATGVITVSWAEVTAPLWAPVLGTVVMVGVALLFLKK